MNLSAMFVRNFYIAAIGFMGAILIATFLALPLIKITVIVAIGFIFILLWSRSLRNIEIKNFLWLGLILISFSLGALRVNVADYSFNQNSDLDEMVGGEVTLTGQIVSSPDVRKGKTFINLKTKEDLLLVSIDSYQEVEYGDIVRVTGAIEVPENFETDLGRTFNYSGYLKAKGIKYKINFGEVKILEKRKGNKFITQLLDFKNLFIEKIERVIAEPAAALGEGLLLGIKQSLGDELETAFRKAGIIHVVVLSGYNIMLVVSFVMFVLSSFFSVKIRTAVGILVIVLFAILVGLSATVVRASIMAALLLYAKSSGRIYETLRGLIVAAIIMLIINPYLLVYDASFQLSFLATLGLILINPTLEKFFLKIIPITKFREIFISTLSTQITVLPLLLYLVGEFSVVAIVVNLIVLPIVPIAMLLTFVAGFLSFINMSLAGLVAVPAYYSLVSINKIALWFSDLSFAAYSVPAFPFYFVILTYLVLFVLIYLIRQKKTEFIKMDDYTLVKEVEDWVIEEEFDGFVSKQK